MKDNFMIFVHPQRALSVLSGARQFASASLRKGSLIFVELKTKLKIMKLRGIIEK